MDPRSIRVGLVQLSVEADMARTIAKTADAVSDAARQGAELVCLQELFHAPYFCQVEDPRYFDLAENVDGPVLTRMGEVARASGVALVVPFFERRAPGLYHNSVAVMGKRGERLALYRKLHIPDDPQFMEKFYFTPGDLGFVSVDVGKLELGTLICWDQWYPEAARLTALRGAEMLVYPTAIGWLPEEKAIEGDRQREAWQVMQRAHAIANGVFVCAVNRVGTEEIEGKRIEFWGHSFIADPMGAVLAQAGEGEEVVVAECDLGSIEKTRQTWPFFRDRRIDVYGGLTDRWAKG